MNGTKERSGFRPCSAAPRDVPASGPAVYRRGTNQPYNLHREHNEAVLNRKWRKKWESHPRQVKPAAAFKAVSSSMPDFFQFCGGSEIRTRDGVNHTCFPGKLLVYPDSLHNRSERYARPVTLRNPGTYLVRPAYKAAVLFELRALKMAECRGLAPLALIRHAFVSTEARLACPVGIPEMVRLATTRRTPARRRS